MRAKPDTNSRYFELFLKTGADLLGFNRDHEDVPEPKGKAVAISFDGPVQSLYATLALRLAHSGLFTTVRIEMWRTVAIITAKAAGSAACICNECAEAQGRLVIFYAQYEG